MQNILENNLCGKILIAFRIAPVLFVTDNQLTTTNEDVIHSNISIGVQPLDIDMGEVS